MHCSLFAFEAHMSTRTNDDSQNLSFIIKDISIRKLLQLFTHGWFVEIVFMKLIYKRDQVSFVYPINFLKFSTAIQKLTIASSFFAGKTNTVFQTAMLYFGGQSDDSA